MRAWAKRAKEWLATGRTVYLAFNNDSLAEGSALPSAILDCRSLARALRKLGALG